MNKTLFFSLLLFLKWVTVVASTSDSLTIKRENKFYYGAYLSPDICFATVKLRPNESGKAHNWEKFQQSNFIPLGYRVGFLLGIKKNRHWWFETGLQLSNKNLNYLNEVNNNDKNQIFHPNVNNLKSVLHFSCIDIPLRAIYNGGKKRLKFLLIMGYDFNYCFNKSQTTTIDLPSGAEQKQTYYLGQPSHFFFRSLEAFAGVSYQLKNNSLFRVSPGIQRTYFSEKTERYKILFWNAGLHLSYIKNFR